jgi:tetratricopeptide (TPR) repeat protein
MRTAQIRSALLLSSFLLGPSFVLQLPTLPAQARAVQQAEEKAPVALAEDWRFYLLQMETNNWDYFGQIDGKAFKAKFWPLLKDPKLGADPEFLLVCGASVNNWAYRDTSLSQEDKDAYFKESFPLLQKAAEGGHWIAMSELSDVLNRGVGTAQDPGGAVEWATKAAGKCEERLGTNDARTANALITLAGLYAERADYVQARPLYERGLRIREKVLGPEHPDTARSLNDLALLYHHTGNYTKAESFYQRALDIDEKVLEPGHPDTVTSLNNLGGLYMDIADYAKAEPLFQRALRLREARGPDSADTAISLNNLANLYRSVGDYAKALPLLLRALSIDEKTLGPEDPMTAAILINLGNLYDSMGDFARAEPLLQRALSVSEKARGPEHPDTATSLSSLAWLYYGMRNYARAEPLYQRALAIFEKVLGPEDPGTAATLNNLADLYWSMGRYAQAERLYKRALSIREKDFGPNHPATAMTLTSLALLYHSTGNYAKAEPLYQRALSAYEKALGPEHPDTATSLNNLAGLYLVMGDYAKAEPLFQRSLRVTEKALGPEHPDTTTSLKNLAGLYLDLGRKAEAFDLAQRAEKSQLKCLQNILSFASEAERLEYQARENPLSLFVALGKDTEVAGVILRHKGVVLDSLLEERLLSEAGQSPQDEASLERLQAARQHLTRLLLERPTRLDEQSLKARADEREKLSREVEQLEGALARRVAGLGRARQALQVTVEQVQATIAKDAALVEMIRYGHYLGTNRWEIRYGAAVLAHSGAPKWVSLGSASSVERNLTEYLQSVRHKSDEARLSALLKNLYQQFWSPIQPLVPAGTQRVILSPDGQLNFVSFATLLAADGQFLGQKYSLRHVSSGRDLLREVQPEPNSEMLVFANPDFGRAGAVVAKRPPNSLVAMREVETRDLATLSLAPLPGTARESAQLVALARGWNWPVTAYLGSEATEGRLRSAHSPHILHMATHGFLLPESGSEAGGPEPGFRGLEGLTARPGAPSQPAVLLKNPMHRSGLALAGAQATLEAWKRGDVPPMDDDGILTAEEVGALKLGGTWLVVLSACDTGVGEARSGEGVLGLRRGFIQAGAQNLLMTLWPVADKETADVMVDFYTAAHKNGDAPGALAQVQRDWLVRLRKERGLSEAVRLAGPFIMSSQGAIR